MPGRNLSRNEEKLLRLWNNPPENVGFKQLRSVEVWSPSGIRGIQSLRLPFKYPIAAICGSNGAGKTTALSLAALAFHSPHGWHVHLGNANPKAHTGDRSYYRFTDFFRQGEGDGTIEETRVTWRYFDGEETSVEFVKTDRWGNYSKRPERPVSYLSLTRILPAYEISGLVRNFISTAEATTQCALTEESLRYLSFVIGKSYSSADVMNKRGLNFQKCTSTAMTYTAFNMGGGEGSVIALLHILQTIPRGGVVIVDEIEAGLHLNAQRRLVDVLTKICISKQIQIICSTHSEFFIDALPRLARIVLKRTNAGHVVVESPSTRYAMYEMDGKCKPELTVYCEDVAAKTMLESALNHDLLIRLNIVTIGPDAKVIRQGISHMRSGFNMRCLCVLDGDVSEQQIQNWIRSERGEREDLELDYFILPGNGLPPERWVAEQLGHRAYIEKFSECFNCDEASAAAHVEAIRIEIDHHSIGYTLGQRVNLEAERCLCKIMDSVAPYHPQLDEIRNRVKELIG